MFLYEIASGYCFPMHKLSNHTSRQRITLHICVPLFIILICGCEKNSVEDKNTPSEVTKQERAIIERITRTDTKYSWDSVSQQINDSPAIKSREAKASTESHTIMQPQMVPYTIPQTDASRILLPRFHRDAIELDALPFWKREEIHAVRLDIQKLLMSAEEDAAKVRKLSSIERKKWRESWMSENRPKLDRLRRQEFLILKRRTPPPPTRQMVDDFIRRMYDRNLELREEDLQVIEYLVPADTAASNFRQSQAYLLLKQYHNQLASRFPQSASRSIN